MAHTHCPSAPAAVFFKFNFVSFIVQRCFDNNETVFLACDSLWRYGIAIGGGGRRVRVVTHLNVGPEDGDALVEALSVELGAEAVLAEAAEVAGQAKL